MADVVANLGANYANLRYRHPFVSEGINKKNVGSPSGILQGGKLSASLSNQSVDINVDPDTGLSVYNYERKSSPLSSVTVVETSDRTLDLSAQAGTTVYVCLYVEYTTTTTTLVQFRTYSESELFGGSPVTEAGDVIILGMVNVPGTAVPIPDDDVVGDQRVDAWQRRSANSRDWKQIFRNGSGAIPTEGMAATVNLPFLSVDVSGDDGSVTHSSTYSRSMLQSIRCNADNAVVTFGPVSSSDSSIQSSVFYPIRSGQRVLFSFYKRAASWAGSTAGEVEFTFRPEPNSSSGSDTVVTKEFDIGTTDSDWVHITGVVEASSSCWFFFNFVITTTVSNTGYVYFDDIRVWVEGGQALEDEGEGDLLGINAPISGSALHLVPANQVSNTEYLGEGAIELVNSYTGTVPTASLSWLGGSTDFELNVAANLNISGNVLLTGSGSHFEYDSSRSVFINLSHAQFMPQMTSGTRNWDTAGTHEWQSKTDSGVLYIPLALPIDASCASFGVRVMVIPGAERSSSDRMSLTIYSATPDWDTPASYGSSPLFGGAAYDNTTTDCQVIARAGSVTVSEDYFYYAEVKAGNDGSTNQDSIIGAQLYYSIAELPRGHTSI